MWLSFYSLKSDFHRATFFFKILMKSNIIFFFMDHTNCSISENTSPNSRSPRFYLMLSSSNFTLLNWHLGIWSILSYFLSKMSDLCLDCYCCCFTCEWWTSRWPSILCLKDYPFFMELLLLFCQKAVEYIWWLSL